MKISILDDYHDTLRTLACFRPGAPINVVNPEVLKPPAQGNSNDAPVEPRNLAV